MNLSFQVAGKPAVQGNHAISRSGHIFEKRSSELRHWREAIAWEARRAIGRGPRGPFAGPMYVHLTFLLPKPASTKRTFPTVRPDADKLARAALDALTGVIWADDAQVVELVVSKIYAMAAFIGCQVKIHAPEVLA